MKVLTAAVSAPVLQLINLRTRPKVHRDKYKVTKKTQNLIAVSCF